MGYKVSISIPAQTDLIVIADYLSCELDNESAAFRFLRKLDEKLLLVSENPEMYPLATNSALAKLDCRFFPVNNYLVFYRIDKLERKIGVLRVIYGKQDYERWEDLKD